MNYEYLGCPATYQAGTEGGGGAEVQLYPGARRRWVVSATPQPLYPRERNIFMATYIVLLIL
jgi:hypothetical protein